METLPYWQTFHYQNRPPELEILNGVKNFHSSQQKWLAKLMRYDYTITYKKGQDNLVVNALSRVPKVVDMIDAQLLTLSCVPLDFLEQIKASYTVDPHLQELTQQL